MRRCLEPFTDAGLSGSAMSECDVPIHPFAVRGPGRIRTTNRRIMRDPIEYPSISLDYPGYPRDAVPEDCSYPRLPCVSPEFAPFLSPRRHTPHQIPKLVTQRRHAAAKRAWQTSSLPPWLDEEAYLQKIQPRLAGVTISVISSALGVSNPYAADIRAGRHRPHPRHWQTLAQLVGVSPDV